MINNSNPFIQMHLKEISAAEKILSESELEPIQNITLSVFEARILPLIQRGEGTPEDIRDWLEITMHPHVALHVYDGDVCKYKIPPLMNMGMTMPNGEFTYADTLQEYRSRLDASPLDAYAFQHKAMMMMADTITDPRDMYIDFITAMNKIFIDYNMPTITLRQGGGSENVIGAEDGVEKESHDTLEVLGYDDI